MKTVIKIAVLLASLSGYLLAQQPLASWRGVYLFDRDSINSLQMRDTLGLNLIQFRSGDYTPSRDSVLKNGAGLRVINQRIPLNSYSSTQHMEFQAEVPVSALQSHFVDKIGSIPNSERTAWYCRPGNDPAGFMVQTAVPDSEYNTSERAIGRYSASSSVTGQEITMLLGAM